MPPTKHSSLATALRNAKYSSAPTRHRQSASLLPILLVALCVMGAIIAYRMFQGSGPETPEMATQALAAQNIEISENGFLSEIKAGHADNVRHFLVLGTTATTQDKDGVIAFNAGIDSSNADVLSLLLTVLPSDSDEAQKLLNDPDSDDHTPIMRALDKKNPALLAPLLDRGADITQPNHAGETPLIYALKHLSTAEAEQVIAEDKRLHHTAVSLTIPDPAGDTPLFYAIRHHDAKLIDILLRANVDVTEPNGSGIVPLMICAEAGDVVTAKQLLAAGSQLDVADKGGNTPMSIAIRNNQKDFVKFLISSGADIDFHTTGPFPVQIAVEQDPMDAELVTYFISHSKQVKTAAPDLFFASIDHKNTPMVNYLIQSHLVNVNTPNAHGETPLYRALESGSADTALLLIDAGADINKTGVAGITSLILCIQRHLPDVAKKLIQKGAQINQKTSEGYNLAEMAAYYGDADILKILLDKGVVMDKNAALLASILNGNGKTVATLLAYGAKPNLVNNKGDSMLWIAADNGQDEACRALIAGHAVVDYRNTELRMTPLAAAAQAGHASTVKLLVEAGATLESKDAYGMTPLAHAVYIANPEIVTYLLSKGADAHVKDGQGRSLTDLAALGLNSQVDNQAARDAILRLLPQ